MTSSCATAAFTPIHITARAINERMIWANISLAPSTNHCAAPTAVLPAEFPTNSDNIEPKLNLIKAFRSSLHSPTVAHSFPMIIYEEYPLSVPVCSIQYFTMNSPVVQNVPLPLSASDPEVNVLLITPINRRPNESTAETITGTIARLKNGLKPTSHKLIPPP